MSGSPDYTLTPNLGLFRPNYDMDDGLWGTHLNANADVLDSAIHALQTASPSGGPFLPTSGGVMLGPITLAGNATLPLHAVPLQQLSSILGGPFLPLAGGSLSGSLSVTGNVTASGIYLIGTAHAVMLNTTQMNAAIGGSPYNVNTTGGSASLRNTFGGVNAGAGIAGTSSSNNTGFGFGVLSAAGTANQETAFGGGALQNDTGGVFNNAFGSNAGLQLTTANANCMFGHGTMGGDDFAPQPLTGSQNTAIGNWAGQEFVTANGNCVMGEYAMASNTDGSQNVAIGVTAMGGSSAPPSSTPNSASNCVAIGTFALRNTTGSNQVAVGWNALTSDVSGVEGTAIGTRALALSQADFRNTAVGYFVMNNLKGGGANTGIGAEALIGATTCNSCTVVGAQAGNHVTSGGSNTMLGFAVGQIVTTGAGNIIIGVSAQANLAAASTSNTLTIQGASTTPAISGININSATPQVLFPGAMQVGATALTLSVGQFGMNTSSLVGLTAPGPSGVKFVVTQGTNAGTAKLMMYAGTSTTGVVIVDNVGAGVA